MGTKNQRAVYEWVNVLDDQVYELGGGGWGGVTSYLWHSTDVRAEYPLSQRCQVYDWPPFFNKKYMNGPIFLDSYVTSWYMHMVYAHIFHSEIFRGCLSS